MIKHGARPLRVLFVESNTELGGPQIALRDMLAVTDRSIIEPHVAVPGTGGQYVAALKALDVPLHDLPAGRFRNGAASWRKLRALTGIVRECGADVVVGNSGHPMLFARPAALWAGVPCVWWVHGWQPEDPLRGQFIAVAEEWLGADAYFCNSAHTARLMHSAARGRGPVRVTRCGTDTEKFYPDPEAGRAARAALEIGTEEKVVGMFGRLQRWKGQHIFLDAVARIVRDGGQLTALVIGGSFLGIEPEYAEELRRIVAQRKLESRVRFLDHRPDVNELLNACDVVVHASIEPEPWGLVVAEAMAAGRAVVASACGGPLEMIEHGRHGLLSAPGDAEALASCIAELLSDAELRARLGRAARARAVAEFDHRIAAQVMCRELCDVRERYCAQRS